jgi:4-amino-4-deoxy-L-arabinose transferase-like glycosyltransferase
MVAQEPNAADRRRAIRDYALAALILAAIYVVYVLVVSPRHEFPLMDDWAYAQSVRHLLYTGQLRISEWSSTTLVFQVYWGALFARLFGGFSFTALRWSTLVFSFITSLALYALLRQLDLGAPAAWLGGLTLVVNPIFVYLSYTFMSDVFYMGLMLLSLAFYVHGIRRDAAWALLAGSALAAGGYLARQLGVLLPIAAAIAWVWRDRRIRLKPLLLIGLIPLLVVVVHSFWLVYIHGVPWGMQVGGVTMSMRLLLQPTSPLLIVVKVWFGAMYLGLFTLPVLVAQVASRAWPRGRLIRLARFYGVWLTLLGVFVVVLTVFVGRHMPFLRDALNRDGIGMVVLNGHKTPVTPDWVWTLMMVAAPLAGAAQGALWTEAVLDWRRESARPGAALLWASLGALGLTVIALYLLDRYLLILLPASLYLVLRLGDIKPAGWWIGLGVCAAMLTYSLVEMGDHLAWNTARWTAGERLVAQGVPPEAIDGGFEWVGWYEFETALPRAIASGQKDDIYAWMALTSRPYKLSFGPLPGYTTLGQVPYRSPLIGHTGQIYMLKQAVP